MIDEKKLANAAMSDEELDKVAGGYAAQGADDSRFLNVLMQGMPGQCDRYGGTRIFLIILQARTLKTRGILSV